MSDDPTPTTAQYPIPLAQIPAPPLVQPHLPGVPMAEPSNAVAQRAQAEAQAAMLALLGDAAAEQQYPWLEQMAHLVARGYEAKQAAVAAWLCMPRDQRVPQTKGELANLLGYSKSTAVAKIAASEGTQAIVQALSISNLVEHLASVDDALVKVATQADYKSERAMNLFYRRLGLLTEQTDVRLVTASATGVENLSSEQIRQRMAEIEARRTAVEVDAA